MNKSIITPDTFEILDKYTQWCIKNKRKLGGIALTEFVDENQFVVSHDAPLMGRGAQLATYNEVGEMAPNDFCKAITDFELLVKRAREAQKSFYKEKDDVKRKEFLIESKKLENKIDEELVRLGYGGQGELF